MLINRLDNLIILEKPSKLYFDLEYEIAANPTIDGPRLTTNFIQVLLNWIRLNGDFCCSSLCSILCENEVMIWIIR